MIKTIETITVTKFDVQDDFYVLALPEKDEINKIDCIDFWLFKKGFADALHMFGVENTYENMAAELIENNIEEYINIWKIKEMVETDQVLEEMSKMLDRKF